MNIKGFIATSVVVKFMDVIGKYGNGAGKIWAALHKNGSLNEQKLMKMTKLDKDTFYASIGWLAREDKICKNDDFFELGTTNLTYKIGSNAGKLWEALSSSGEIDVTHLVKYIKIPEEDVYCAVGWLARENKIQGKKKRLKGVQPTFTIK